MKHLFLFVTQYLGYQNFQGKVRAQSQNLNIQYLNDDPIHVEISNVINNQQGLIGKVVHIVITSENPVKGNLEGYITEEAEIIQFTQ
ncbi:hypothetical protein [Rufibacter ruber]|uniref:hypothetical protein n=1 Tax=Rufibacter ruber TaxID=1783499 RepID=UPI00082E981D|nr:hypothetical protein [Rufibacter ruber]